MQNENTRGDLKYTTREECLEKAIDFLHMLVHLQLIVRENEEEEDDTRKKEVFSFPILNVNGIPIRLEVVIVAVNRETGQIDYYNGPSFGIEQLGQIPTETKISQKDARDIFLKHLDFELAWEKDYESEAESYMLVYKACDRYSRTPILYIDAITGEIIFVKDK